MSGAAPAVELIAIASANERPMPQTQRIFMSTCLPEILYRGCSLRPSGIAIQRLTEDNLPWIFYAKTFRRSVEEIGPQILYGVKQSADEDVVAILSIENDVRLEPEAPRADQQLVGCDAHLGKSARSSN